MGAFRDMTGMTFGRLTVLGERKRQGPHLSWLCHCECGQEKWVLGYDLWQGKTRSCGCLQASGPRPKHGHARRHRKTRTYRCWKNMLTRCRNPNNPGYSNYGDRGVQVCNRWLNFEAFLTDMGECPEGLTIERINNEGNYEPGNCKWETRKRQARNQRTTLMIEYKGITRPLADWCEELQLSYGRTYQRHLAGSPPEVMFDPISHR